MSERVIPVEAVEAAARALTVEVYGVDMFDGMSDDAQEVLRRRGTFLLEAAAPHIIARAFRDAADQLEYGNPINEWLYELADALEEKNAE
jgi:hypothetical protein